MPRNAVRTVVFLLGVVLSAGTTFGFGARSFKSGPLQITADGAWVIPGIALKSEIMLVNQQRASYAGSSNYCRPFDRSDCAHARINELRMEYARPLHI